MNEQNQKQIETHLESLDFFKNHLQTLVDMAEVALNNNHQSQYDTLMNEIRGVSSRVENEMVVARSLIDRLSNDTEE